MKKVEKKRGFFGRLFGGKEDNAEKSKIKKNIDLASHPLEAPEHQRKKIEKVQKKLAKELNGKAKKIPKKTVLEVQKRLKKEIDLKEKFKESEMKKGKKIEAKRGKVSTKEKKEKVKGEKKGKAIKHDPDKYVHTGVAGFDELFNENMGIPFGSSILVEGGPGSGKTLFCLTTLASMCSRGKKCLYMSFEESEENLLNHMEGFGWPAREWVKKGVLRVKRFDAIDVSRSIEALLSAAKKELLIEVDPVFFPKDYDPDFVAVDSLTSISSAFSGQESRFRIYMEQLFRYLEKNKITNFLIREVSSPSHIGTTFKEQGEAVSFLSDGIIVIYNVIYDSGERASAIEILKMRGISFKRRIVDLRIDSKGGVHIDPNKILAKKKGKGFELT
ncbi:hypothetical protein HOA55_00995 [archaeon]|jgi:KaiC/GvpD/RAD55 family RecA-like ATPase|nr:hypothetical protein [archaeon]MBT3577623.1 hypothetical protein [archaeon]MBT6819911.1 hypothetical protein [archaeon]MBT6956679.1 hypothetical protein [archaeon]MBT7025067.1 hypothetical protein [archaeon]